MIEARNITKVYQTDVVAVRALDNVTLGIRRGEFVAIMGSSGSGKSTMMNILGCLDKPTSGDYFLCGARVNDAPRTGLAKIRNEIIGFVFQSFNLLPRLTALENVELPLTYAGDKSKKEQRRSAKAKLEEVGLSDRANHKPEELSGGQRQRVAIARSLVNDPKIILADEPTGNLDKATGRDVMRILCDLNSRGVTIVLVTHDSEVAEYAQRTIYFEDGKIINHGNN